MDHWAEDLHRLGATPDEIEDLTREHAEDLADNAKRPLAGWQRVELGERWCPECGREVPALPRCERCGNTDPDYPF